LLLALFTGGLIVVGALQFVALNRQARTLVHHSELLGTSVAAAQRTSQALMDGQRGWILVEKVDPPDMRVVMDAQFQGTVPFLVFRFKVFGFTPCKIRNAAMRFHLAEVTERELPPEPRLPQSQNTGWMFLAQTSIGEPTTFPMPATFWDRARG
jgi:hypothetical protein